MSDATIASADSILYHFSEDPTITHFEPRVAPTQSDQRRVVWAMDRKHSPLYFFPRNCPRVGYWALPTTTPEDRERFLGDTAAWMVQAIEAKWREPMRETCLYRYALPAATFEPSQKEGFYGGYISFDPVTPVGVEPVGDLMTALCDAGVELRLTPSLWPLHDALLSATLHYSMIRMRHAAPRPAPPRTDAEITETL